jgi:hypothetical protein
MTTIRTNIHSCDDASWVGWGATEYINTGRASRRLRANKRQDFHLALESQRELLAVLCLAEAPKRHPKQIWRVTDNDNPVKIHLRKTFPRHLLLEIPTNTRAGARILTFEPIFKASNVEYDLFIEEVAVMPLEGRFSELWTSPFRALRKLIKQQTLRWAPADFPYSHFDGLGYLLEHDEVRKAVLSRKFDSAFRYYYRKGRHRGHELPLAVAREPLPGTAFNLVMHYQGAYSARNSNHAPSVGNELNSLRRENELLLLELHQLAQSGADPLEDREGPAASAKEPSSGESAYAELKSPPKLIAEGLSRGVLPHIDDSNETELNQRISQVEAALEELRAYLLDERP